MAEKKNACRFFVARAEGITNLWEGLRVGFSIILKFILKKDDQPVTEMGTKNISWWGKGGLCVGLTNLPLSCTDCHKFWEPQPPGTLRACPGFYRDCCSFSKKCDHRL
jgi:hypothetical protein